MGTRELLVVLAVVVMAAVGAGAQSSSASPAPATSQAPTVRQQTPFGRTMSTVITVSISVFFFLLFFCAYINQCRLAEAGDARAAAAAAAGGGAGGGPSRRGKRGLDPAVVATFPIVPYREVVKHKIGKSVLECAVCLTSFDDGDDLRLLPHCSHAFHPECIDPWLESRVTCPLCRANLEKPPPPPPLPAAAAAKEEAVELEMLRSERRAARLPRSHSTGHSLVASAAAAAESGDHERFTLRLPQHVRDEVLRSLRLRHAASLVNLSDMSSEGSSRGGRRALGLAFGNGGGSSHGGRRWQAFLARTVSWARGGGDGSVRRGWDGSTRRGKDDAESSRKGATSPAAGRP
uniref:RING-type E3 ubiquitin transferase n=1 Tax=Oryza glumipatula TaxID=40148 RepID=A0A0D9ZLH0_9ORYZ